MTYIYYCPICNKKKEIEHSMNDKIEIECFECKELLIKKITAPSVIFKGDNWADKQRKVKND